MRQLTFSQGGWTCYSIPELAEHFQGGPDLLRLTETLRELPIILKDNHRSVVLRGTLFGRDLVAKRPIDKNKRLWSKLTSLMTPSEAAATHQNLFKMKKAGVPSVMPLFALEKRQFGMIVDSWICYEYREGTPSDSNNLSQSIHFLDNMHAHGFRHDDPTWNNFFAC